MNTSLDIEFLKGPYATQMGPSLEQFMHSQIADAKNPATMRKCELVTDDTLETNKFWHVRRQTREPSKYNISNIPIPQFGEQLDLTMTDMLPEAYLGPLFSKLGAVKSQNIYSLLIISQTVSQIIESLFPCSVKYSVFICTSLFNTISSNRSQGL